MTPAEEKLSLDLQQILAHKSPIEVILILADAFREVFPEAHWKIKYDGNTFSIDRVSK